MKKLSASLITILMLALGITMAHAGEDYSELDLSLSRDGNGKSVQMDVASFGNVRITQTGPMRFIKQPNGELTAPIWLEIAVMNISPTESTSVPASLDGASINMQSAAPYVHRKTIRLPINLINADGMQYNLYVPGANDSTHTIRISSKMDSFHSANGLYAETPEFKGITVNTEESRENYWVLEMDKGVAIPSPSKWSFYVSHYDMEKGNVQTPAQIDAIEGYMRKDGNGRYLPPDDAKILAAYPELANKCIITLTHYNENGTSSFMVIEGRWPSED